MSVLYRAYSSPQASQLCFRGFTFNGREDGRIYTYPALRPYQLGPMRVPECNHKVTGSGYEAVDSYEAVNRRL